MKGRLTLWAVAALLTVAVVGLSLRFIDPFPPNRIVLATGQPGGAYDGFGREYQSRLAREGLARRLALPHQRDVYHCRLHVALVLNEARDRLQRTEHAPPR